MALYVTLFVIAAFATLILPLLYFTWLAAGEEVHRPGGDVGGERA